MKLLVDRPIENNWQGPMPSFKDHPGPMIFKANLSKISLVVSDNSHSKNSAH